MESRMNIIENIKKEDYERVNDLIKTMFINKTIENENEIKKVVYSPELLQSFTSLMMMSTVNVNTIPSIIVTLISAGASIKEIFKILVKLGENASLLKLYEYKFSGSDLDKKLNELDTADLFMLNDLIESKKTR